MFGTAYPKTVPAFQRFLRAVIVIATSLILLSPLLITDIPGFRIDFPFVFPKALLFQSLVEIMIVCWIPLMILDKRVRPNFTSPVTIGIGIFLATLLATHAFGVDPIASFWSNQNDMMGLFQYIHFAFWFLILTSLFRERTDWTRLFLFSTYVSVAVSILGFCEWFKIGFGRIGSTLGNPLILSTYLLIHIFIVCLLLIEKPSHRKPLFWILGFELFTLLLTGSRSSFLGLAVASIVAIILFRKTVAARVEQTIHLPKKFFFPIFLLLLVVSVVGLGLFEKSHSGGSSLLRSNSSDRVELWNIALRASAEKPIFGWGLEQFSVPFNNLFDPTQSKQNLTEMWYSRAHNQFLDLLVSNGIIGLVGYLMLWSSIVWMLFQRRSEQTEEKKKIAITFFLFVIAFLIEKFFLFDLFIEQVLLFFVFASLPIFFARDSIQITEQTDPSKKRSTLAILCLLLLFVASVPLIVFANIRPFADELRIKTAEEAFMQGEISNASIAFKHATNHPSPYKTDMILHMNEPLLAARLMFGIDSEEMMQLLKTMQNTILLIATEHPTDPKLAFAQAWFAGTQLGDANSQAFAKQTAERAQELAPKRAEPLLVLAQIARTQNRFDDAHKLLDEAKQRSVVEETKGQPTFENAGVYAAEGKYPEAFQELEQAFNLGAQTYGDVSFFTGLIQGSEKHPAWPEDMNPYITHMIKKYPKLPNILEGGITLYHNGGYTRQEKILFDQLTKIDTTRAEALSKRFTK